MGAMNSSQIEIKCLANGMGPYMGAMNSSQIEIKCLANGMGPYMGSQRVTGSPVRKAHRR
ncbi:MAG: hypothetical protein WAqPseu_17510 [Shewanella algae]